MKPSNRKSVKDEDVRKVGTFAVFRHTTKLSRAHFCSLHDTYDSASGEAVRLLMLSFGAAPETQHDYYVVTIKARFSAGPDGLTSDDG